MHEVYRVFYDRLVEDADRTWLYQLVRECVKNHFKDNFDTVFEHLASQPGKVRSGGNSPVDESVCLIDRVASVVLLLRVSL